MFRKLSDGCARKEAYGKKGKKAVYLSSSSAAVNLLNSQTVSNSSECFLERQEGKRCILSEYIAIFHKISIKIE